MANSSRGLRLHCRLTWGGASFSFGQHWTIGQITYRIPEFCGSDLSTPTEGISGHTMCQAFIVKKLQARDGDTQSPRASVPHHTVLRSDMTLTMLPGPAISTSFSCQLSRTLIACPPPSPPPRECICENPVDCGDIERVEADEGCEVWDMPLYL